MSTIGIISTTQGLKLARLSGHRDQPLRQPLVDSIKFPAEEDEGRLLHTLGKSLLALFNEQKPGQLCLLKVVGNQHNHPAEIRVKVEGLMQMLGARLDIPTRLIAPVTLRNQEKKFDIFTGQTPEACLNEGKKFKSVDLRSAVLTAWVGLPET